MRTRFCQKCGTANTNPPSYKGVFYCRYCGHRAILQSFYNETGVL
jgi:DNA-directed RNA polymerase subunit RPC12/RpoP